MSEEYVRFAGRDHRRDRWLRRLPLIIAAVLAVPLLWLSIRFSWEYAQIAALIIQLGTDGWTQFLLVLMSIAGFVLLVTTLACLFIGTRRSTWRWRLWWAAAALIAAGALPLSWVFLGYLTPAP